MRIGAVFRTAWTMLRQRFWLLAGMWAVFFAIQIAGSMVLGVAAVAAGAAGAAGLEAALGDPAALAGMGIGMIAVMAVVYAGYLVLVLAQQAALVTLASPLEPPDFGAALARGFRSALPFFGLTVMLVLAYGALLLATGALASAAGDAAGAAVGVLLAALSFPAMIYLACRLAVLIPVVAVDRVSSPLGALRRCWRLTRGRAGAILLALLALAGLIAALCTVPFVAMIAIVLGAQQGAVIAAGAVLVGVLLFVPLLIVVSLYVSAFIAALHSELTGGAAETLEAVFA